jgi:hypothetical protein
MRSRILLFAGDDLGRAELYLDQPPLYPTAADTAGDHALRRKSLATVR